MDLKITFADGSQSVVRNVMEAAITYSYDSGDDRMLRREEISGVRVRTVEVL